MSFKVKLQKMPVVINPKIPKNREPFATDACKASASQQMGLWFMGRSGRHLLNAERRIVEHSISRFFGYHQLELLLRADTALGGKSLLGHRILAVPELAEDCLDQSAMSGKRKSTETEGLLLCEPDELPLASDSIDLVILHHTLDATTQPHQTLREACRVLRSGGHIVIVGFNPVSIWGLRRFLNRDKNLSWPTRFLSASRLEDWLSLLDFQLQDVNHKFFAPPIKGFKWLRGFGFLKNICRHIRLPMGFFYIMQAQKRVGGSIVIQPRWKQQAVAEATVVHQLTSYRKHEKN